MNMIDQVAMALCPERWEAISDVERELWRSRARTAVKAMDVERFNILMEAKAVVLGHRDKFTLHGAYWDCLDTAADVLQRFAEDTCAALEGT